MTSIDDTGAVAGPTPGRTARTDQLLRLVVTGLTATLAAMVVTTSLAGLAKALGVDFAVTNSTEAIPVPGIAVVTGFFSVVGVVIAVALRRWSARPAERFLRTAVSLTAISLVPPVVFGADAATTVALVGLHLVAAAVMIPALVRSLRTRTDRAGI